MLKKRIVALIAAMAMLVTILPIAIYADDDTIYATRGQVADMLIGAADDYTPDLTKTDIIKGYEDGSLREDQPVTRAESFVMLSRAFGTLPMPVGNDLRTGSQGVDPAGVPDWAQADVDNLTKTGIVVGTADNDLGAEENVTIDQMMIMIRRVWALLGSNVKDDFYNAVNKEFLDNSTINPGETTASTFDQTNDTINDRLTEIINHLATGTFEPGSKEQKVADFYKSVLDTETRNELGIAPLQPYLDALDKATTVRELFDTIDTLKEEGGLYGLVDFALSADLKDSTSYAVYLISFTPSLTKDQYTEEIGEKQQAYLDYLTTLFELSGETAETASGFANQIYAMEKTISANRLEQQDMNNVDKIYNPFTLDELQALYPALDLKKILTGNGLTVPDQIIVQDVEMTKASAAYFTDENIDLLKAYARLSVVSNFASTLDDRFEEASQEYQKKLLGISGSKTPEETASLYTQSLMGNYLGQFYVEEYFSPEAKADVENMVKEFIGIFKERIKKLDWMSESTKEMAAKKLDTMTIKIGYPDNWESYMDDVKVIGPEAGVNTFFENIKAVSSAARTYNYSMQGQPVDKTTWMMSAYTVNAYYNASANEIVFPAGILQSPFYDINAPKEQNLGAIGVVIAHEITHAFDNNGAKFDEKGNAANWWTEEDYSKFQEYCNQVIEYYDGWEAAPGITNNGTLTLSENIADIGGMSCALDAMKRLESPDYDVFFRSYANLWGMTYTREALEYIKQVDVHSLNKLRTNRVVSGFDEFYQTYGVSSGDGMYVSPADRVKIW